MADAAARALGHDPQKLHEQALEQAYAAGFDGVDALQKWAESQPMSLGGSVIGGYVRAYVEGEAAAEIHKQGLRQAHTAGFHEADALVRWAESVDASELVGGVGAYAKDVTREAAAENAFPFPEASARKAQQPCEEAALQFREMYRKDMLSTEVIGDSSMSASELRRVKELRESNESMKKFYPRPPLNETLRFDQQRSSSHAPNQEV